MGILRWTFRVINTVNKYIDENVLRL